MADGPAPLAPGVAGAGAGAGGAGGGFDGLPAETMSQIMKNAIEAEAGNIIEISIDRKAELRKTGSNMPWRTTRRWYLHWTYTLPEVNPSPLAQRPHTLQLNRQPPIRFNADVDTIFIDCESLFNLFHYVLVWRTIRKAPLANLIGFNLIQKLGHFYAAVFDDPDEDGLAVLTDPAENVLTGITRIRLLGERGRHPGPRPGGYNPDLLPVVQRPLNLRLERSITNKMVADNSGKIRPLAAGQQRVLDAEIALATRNGGEVDSFFTPNSTNRPLVTPLQVG
ncbi:hypothetical protein V8E51_007584 [Hyaloscypha variabilis]